MTREELILRELNLYPLWQRRGLLESALAETAHQDPPTKNQPLIAGQAKTERSQVEKPADLTALDWTQLKSTVKNCTICALRAGCTQPIFGAGAEQADWLIISGAPGAEDDARNEPLLGQAGILLDNMLAAIKLKRGSNVYLTNIVKCHPLDGRKPTVDEIAQCLPYLQRQIALLQPKLIMVLGRDTALALLGRDTAVSSLRGKVHDYQGIPLIVTYHPDDLLRAPLEKAKAWQDLRLAVATRSEDSRD